MALAVVRVTSLVACLCAALAAQAMDITALQRLLQSRPQPAYRFDEQRESPWLAAPIRTQGRLRASDGVLEKIVESPRQEIWRLLPDRMQWVRPGQAEGAEIRYSAVPAVGALADAIRLALTGDVSRLARGFDLALAGDERLWILRGVPRGAGGRRAVKEIELQGSGALLKVLIVVDGQGERTLTRLEPLT